MKHSDELTPNDLVKLGKLSNQLTEESMAEIVNQVRDEHVFALHAALQRAIERHRSNAAMLQYLNAWKIQLGLEDFEAEYDEGFKNQLHFADQLSQRQRREMNDLNNKRSKRKKKGK